MDSSTNDNSQEGSYPNYPASNGSAQQPPINFNENESSSQSSNENSEADLSLLFEPAVHINNENERLLQLTDPAPSLFQVQPFNALNENQRLIQRTDENRRIPGGRRIKIPFRIHVRTRRNVDKCIIRRALKLNIESSKEIRSLLIAKGMSEEAYVRACNILKTIDNYEKGKENNAKDVMHDYKKIITKMLSDPALINVLRFSLMDLLTQYVNGNFGGIRENNKEAYIHTVEDYLNYISSINP